MLLIRAFFAVYIPYYTNINDMNNHSILSLNNICIRHYKLVTFVWFFAIYLDTIQKICCKITPWCLHNILSYCPLMQTPISIEKCQHKPNSIQIVTKICTLKYSVFLIWYIEPTSYPTFWLQILRSFVMPYSKVQ